MTIHFNTRSAAIAHLNANGWTTCKTGRFVSRDGSCVAQINPKFGEVVLVQIWERGMV
jgi:hypothetical protein